MIRIDRQKIDYKEAIVNEDYDVIKNIMVKLSGKTFGLYIAMAKLYNDFPETIQVIIHKVVEWKTLKELILMLIVSRNKSMNEYILNHIIQVLKEDQDKMNRGEKFSTMAKYVPREKSPLNKKTDFIDKLCKKMFPEETHKIKARKKYRRMVADLNKKLDTTEIKLCARQFDQIKFSNVGYRCLQKNFDTFLKDPICKQNLIDHLTRKYINMNPYELVNHALNINNRMKPLERQLLCSVWERKKVIVIDTYNKHLEINIGKQVLLLDMDKTMYDAGLTNVCLVMALLTDKNVYINSSKKEPVLVDLDKCGDMIDKLSFLIKSCCDTDSLQLNGIIKLVRDKHDKCKDILVVTNKNVSFRVLRDYFSQVTDETGIRLNYWMLHTQRMINRRSRNLKLIGGNLYTVPKYIDRKEIKKNQMKQIVNESDELKKTLITNKIGAGCMILVIVLLICMLVYFI
jgi:hypothetical protein